MVQSIKVIREQELGELEYVYTITCPKHRHEEQAPSTMSRLAESHPVLAHSPRSQMFVNISYG